MNTTAYFASLTLAEFRSRVGADLTTRDEATRVATAWFANRPKTLAVALKLAGELPAATVDTAAWRAFLTTSRPPSRRPARRPIGQGNRPPRPLQGELPPARPNRFVPPVR